MPLTDEIVDAVCDCGGSVPTGAPVGRNPSLIELCDACSALEGVSLDRRVSDKSWQATIDGPGKSWASLTISNYDGDEASSRPMAFEKGWADLIAAIVKVLAQRCGSLILWPDTGDVPLVITDTADVDALLDAWK